MDELDDTIDMSLEDPSIHKVNSSPAPLTYELMEETSKRKRELLIDSNGYRYTVKRRLKSTVHWYCATTPALQDLVEYIKQNLDFQRDLASLDMVCLRETNSH